jgi:multiple sugar transport system permease protein
MNYRKREALAAYIYILPSFVILLGISIIPIFMALGFSFTKYNIVNPPSFVGVDNYFRLFKDLSVKSSLQNTFIYTVLVVPIQTVLSLVLAAILANSFQNKVGGFIKSSMFIPVISSGILVATIWTFFLATDNGVVNQLLGIFRISPINWLGQTNTSLISICIISIWKNVGYFLIIYYAGIMDIPRSIMEAAEVEGAGPIQRFYYIMLPYLKPITFLVVTLGTIWSFQIFDLVYLMTNGGPGRSTMTLVLTIYNAAFLQYNFGYACAVAFLLFAFVLAVSAVLKLIFREKD